MIELVIPGLPPSTNHAYVTVRGRRMLSKEGKKFKLETTSYLSRNYPGELQLFQKNTAYGVLFTIWTPDLENKGWPEKAETRYKRFDGSNRVKLIEDALVDAVGVDDCNFLVGGIRKAFHPTEWTSILCWNIHQEGVFPQNAYERFRRSDF